MVRCYLLTVQPWAIWRCRKADFSPPFSSDGSIISCTAKAGRSVPMALIFVVGQLQPQFTTLNMILWMQLHQLPPSHMHHLPGKLSNSTPPLHPSHGASSLISTSTGKGPTTSSVVGSRNHSTVCSVALTALFLLQQLSTMSILFCLASYCYFTGGWSYLPPGHQAL